MCALPVSMECLFWSWFCTPALLSGSCLAMLAAQCRAATAVTAYTHMPTSRQCRFFKHSRTCRHGSACPDKHISSHISGDAAGSSARHKPHHSHQQQHSQPWPGERAWQLAGPAAPVQAEHGRWRFSVATFNLLADQYARQYRNYLYREVPSAHLEWPHRLAAILSELEYWAPDVICLQEVDHYEDLHEALHSLGYEGMYLKRSGSRRDGCATFWRASLFKAAAVRRVSFHEHDLSDNVALLVALQPLVSQQQQRQQQEQQRQQQPQDAHILHEAWQRRRSSNTLDAGVSASSSASELYSMELDPTTHTASDGSSDAGGPPAGFDDCYIVVSNTHLLFSPDKGEVKLGQTRMMVQQAAQMVTGLQQQHQRQQQLQQQSRQNAARSRWDDVTGVTQRQRRQQQDQEQQQQQQQCASPSALCIFAGDFNSMPGSPLYTYMTDAQLDLSGVHRRRVGGQHEHGRGYQRYQRHLTGRHLLKHSNPGSRRASIDHGQGQQQQQQQQERQGSAVLAATATATANGSTQMACALNSTSSGSLPHASSGASEATNNNRASSNANTSSSSSAFAGSISRAASSTLDAVTGTAHSLMQAAARVARASSSGGDVGRVWWSDRDLRRATGQSLQQLKEAGGSVGSSVDGGEDGPLVMMHPMRLQSSYRAVLGDEPDFTSSHMHFMGTCDYIFYTPDNSIASSSSTSSSSGCARFELEPVAVLLPPDGLRLRTGLPSQHMGSDHLCLVTDFEMVRMDSSAGL